MTSMTGGSSRLGLRIVMFCLVFSILQLGWQALRGSALERAVIHDGAVKPAAWLINTLTPHVHVRAVDFSLHARGGGLNILNGCEGVEALFLLVAAFLAAPLPLRARAIGMAAGVVVVFVVNQARILVLFYAYRADQALFDPLHGTVTPIAVVLVILGYFYAWLQHTDPRVSTTT